MEPANASTPSRDRRGIQQRARVDEYARWIWDRIEPYVGERVLEVGCGGGMLVPWIRDRREAYLGIDPGEKLIEANRRRWEGKDDSVRFLRRDLFDVDLEDSVKAFGPDTVVCLNVLEHLEEDRRAVRRFRRFLPPGGGVVLQVPAHPWLYGANDRAVGHERRYRRAPFRELLRRDFEEVEVEAFNAFGIVPWWLNGRVLGRESGYFEGKSERELGWLNRLVPTIRRLDAWLSLPVGVSFFGFGRAAGSS